MDSVYFVCEELYRQFEKDLLTPFLKEVGINECPRRLKFCPDFSYEQKAQLRNNANITMQVELADYELEGLRGYLSKEIHLHDSNLLWKILAKCVRIGSKWDAINFFNGVYQWSYYRNTRTQEFEAKFLGRLRNQAWLYDKDEILKKPSEIYLSELHHEYPINDQNTDVFIQKLGFKPDIIQQLPPKLRQRIELIEDIPEDELLEMITDWKRKKQKPESSEKDEDTGWQPKYEPSEIELDIEELDPAEIESLELENQVERYSGQESSSGNETKIITDFANDAQNHEKTEISNESQKTIGNWGEKAVVEALKTKYQNNGGIEITDFGFKFFIGAIEHELRWLNKDSDRGIGYDIVILKDSEDFEYIEVKTKTDANNRLISITGTQWEFARKLYNSDNGNKYLIYVVTNAGGNVGEAKIRVIRNPIKLWKEGKLYAHPINFML